jgi:predicted transcriptional regulator
MTTIQKMNRPLPAADSSKKRPQELTRAEFEIMQILWEKKHAVVNDIREAMPEPRAAYNTVSTIVRILEQKGFVGHTAHGRTHEYRPVMERAEYTEQSMKGVLSNFFDGSLTRMVSFLGRSENVSTREFDNIIDIINTIKNERP